MSPAWVAPEIRRGPKRRQNDLGDSGSGRLRGCGLRRLGLGIMGHGCLLIWFLISMFGDLRNPLCCLFAYLKLPKPTLV